MSSKQQQPTDTEVLIGHEIDTFISTIIGDETKTWFTNELAKRAQNLGLRLDNDGVPAIFDEFISRIRRHFLRLFTDEQYSELRSLVNDHIGFAQWLDPYIPILEEIVADEQRQLYTALKLLSLRLQGKYDKDGISMTVETIIEQAQAEILQPEPPVHPKPDVGAELRTTALDSAHLDDVFTELRARDIPLSAAEVEVTIAGLHEISERTGRVARELGLYAVQHDLMPKTKLAKLLNVSKMTITRWTREKPERPDEPQT